MPVADLVAPIIIREGIRLTGRAKDGCPAAGAVASRLDSLADRVAALTSDADGRFPRSAMEAAVTGMARRLHGQVEAVVAAADTGFLDEGERVLSPAAKAVAIGGELRRAAARIRRLHPSVLPKQVVVSVCLEGTGTAELVESSVGRELAIIQDNTVQIIDLIASLDEEAGAVRSVSAAGLDHKSYSPMRSSR